MIDEYLKGRKDMALEIRRFLEANWEKDDVVDMTMGLLDGELGSHEPDTSAKLEGEDAPESG